MYSEELENLMEMALAEGELSEKKREILKKRAQSEGIDLDEFEMVLDARIAKIRKERATTIAPKSNKFGDVRKCPSCGTILQSFQTVCPECGQEFSGVNSVQTAQQLFDALQAAELNKTEQLSKVNEEKNKKLSELSTQQRSEGKVASLIGDMGGSTRNERLEEERQRLIEEYDNTYKQLENKLDQEKRNIIKNFPVPNAKEDLLELLSMATSNAINNGRVGPEQQAWLQKTDQIYKKIKICSSNDKGLLDEATNMIVGLMQRLPSGYRNFTEVPQNVKAQLEEEQKARKAKKLKKTLIWIGVGVGGLILLTILGEIL